MYSKSIIPKERNKQIEYILEELRNLKKIKNNRYAIKQNILFFKALQSIPRYIKWLYGIRRLIQKTRLLEINEIIPELDEEFHSKMASVERQARPGIIKPIVDHIYLLSNKVSKNERFRIASIGSGSMEAERQSIELLHTNGFSRHITVIGFDSSSNTREFARKNIGTIPYVRVVMEDQLTEEKMRFLESKTQESVLVIIAGNDVFSLDKDFQPLVFSLIMTALFLHHLPMSSRVDLISRMRTLSKNTLNYDGYQNEFVLPLISITGWNNPVFLNAAIFSSVRFDTKSVILKIHEGTDIHFYKHGHYLAFFPPKK